jgi:plasmid stabilization system protein ParE
MNVEFLKDAEEELDEAFAWYESQKIGLGFQFIDEFNSAMKRILSFPLSYPFLEKDVRRCLIKRFPYGIVYGIHNDTIVIVAVAHLHRQPSYWIERLS